MAAFVATMPPLVVATALAGSTPAAPDPPDAGFVSELVGRAQTEKLAESREWQVLLHYRESALGGWRSEADGDGFFLAGKKGRTDPKAELEATIRALVAAPARGDAAPDEHAQCRFPARWEWLKRKLKPDPTRAPDRRCPVFEAWETGISATAATLVYATAFLNSPASMYGHTFLRVSRATGEGNPLLDYVVNFAADVDTENGLVYAFKGVMGLFPGRFYVMPYYVKVQEYSNMESRDLWEYELSFSPEQVRRLVKHTWETRSTHFNYLFFTRNCSYHLLSLLEVADPSLRLMREFSGSVIPSDTVRAVLAQPGLVSTIRPRPSLLSVVKQRKDALTGSEVRAAETWSRVEPAAPAPPPPADATKERQALVIDAAYDYLRFREGMKAEPSERFKAQERKMLLARGRLGVPPQEVVTRPQIGAPESGHASLRVGLGGGASYQGGAFATLSVRGAIHDYLDPPRGYPPDARLQMGELRLRFDERSRDLRLDRLDVIDIVSAAPLDRWVRGVSWKVWFGADNARELGCERPGSDRAGWRCLYAGLVTGGGMALRFGPRRTFLLLMLAETEAGAGPAFNAVAGAYRLGAGGEAMLAGGLGNRWRFELGARYVYFPLGQQGGVLRGRVGQAFMLSRYLGMRAGVETAGTYAGAGLELMGYF